ncbi:MAG: glutamate synthase [Candidatus Abyssobacteria bacterium SURF_5]|uniref:Glutamate synthase n=1 Tax=Abyssobacteria bacterium (strain SURF_5) TaxID=2093360 RepID=A0A3A4NRC2_ABYX5|nr:MAG: glutamate synthase [Candidatus Abyssubacteria bacterium SURF_5]
MDMKSEFIIRSREPLLQAAPACAPRKEAEEGGCGVVGFACSIPVGGKHIYEPSCQMHNRGNGKGGGIAAVGFVPEQLGITRDVLDSHYILQIGLLNMDARKTVEEEFILPHFDVAQMSMLPTVDNYRDIEGLEVRPPDVLRCIARVKPAVLDGYIRDHSLDSLSRTEAEDEFVYQNSFRLNQNLYASLGEKKAFVLSHGRNMMILKIVGYAEKLAQYYLLEDFKAHCWIAHQRYPTKGRVWHPGGAHPFMGMHEALVHNGDFANYVSVCEYLKMRNVYPLFLTDTEVSIQLFDLWKRVYRYPLEYVIEAMAPTTELDFNRLPAEKQRIYRQVQACHMHGSPDGPWFFIIGRNDVENNRFQLIGITDTSMLRPQVFAFTLGEVSIGLCCSEKQAIDATLHSLAQEDPRFHPIADKYWNARGGSHTDGGAFIFTVSGAGENKKMTCANKFGIEVTLSPEKKHRDRAEAVTAPKTQDALSRRIRTFLKREDADGLFAWISDSVARWRYNTLAWVLQESAEIAEQGDRERAVIIAALTLLNDRRYATGKKKRSSVLELVRLSLHSIFRSCPAIESAQSSRYRLIGWENRHQLRAPVESEQILVIDAAGFAPEGPDCHSHLLIAGFRLGWRRFIAYNFRGERFSGCGFGPETQGVIIDLYDSTGDYVASGIDGMEIYIHGDGQDQLAQIIKQGKLVVYGDVGQTFMYGAKGGSIYVMGNAAGRPLINAVGRPRVVVNGTCLDYLAESFMAGDALNGGGFVVLNAVEFDEEGSLRDLPFPYPGSNLFSLASGGAIYVRDPHRLVADEQLNGGEFAPMTAADWQLILPHLQENERLFGISVMNHLLTVNGKRMAPEDVYRKVRPVKLAVLAKVAEHE